MPTPASTETALKENHWVVVRFKLEETTGERRWIGKILRVNENDTLNITFSRAKRTNYYSGYIYIYTKNQ